MTRRAGQLPDCRTLILTGLSQPGSLPRAPQAHALGFVVKDKPAASLIDLSPANVRNYLSNASTKVGARNRICAIRIARDAGWL